MPGDKMKYVTADHLTTEMLMPVLLDFIDSLRKRSESRPRQERLLLQLASNLLSSAYDALRLAIEAAEKEGQ